MRFIGMKSGNDILFATVPPEMEKHIVYLDYIGLVDIMFRIETEKVSTYSGMGMGYRFENILEFWFENKTDEDLEDFEEPQRVKETLKLLGEYFDTKVLFDGKPL